jgi:dihydrofolate reductase
MMTIISGVVAIAENRVMGKNNQLPWHLPADLRHFKNVTMGKPILMGRKTYESIGKPLPGRCNVIITSDETYHAPGCVVATCIDNAFAAVSDSEEICIIGGAGLFQQTLPQIQCLYLTIIHHPFDGDTFFPELDWSEWKEIQREDHQPDDSNRYAYSFLTLLRI